MPTSNPARHVPVLMREVERGLDLHPGITVVDGTVGAGGHSKMIADRIGSNGRLIGIDRDLMMLGHAGNALAGLAQVTLKHGSYIQIPDLLNEIGIVEVDRILLDLGLSSDQLADESRGFGFSSDGPLDLRFDRNLGKSAAEYLRTVDEKELEHIFREFGEEPQSGRIASWIIQTRSSSPITSGVELADSVMKCLGISRREAGDKHPATRIFQALRIAVNDELSHVSRGLQNSVYGALKVGGIAAVITFHSLEDRIVKQEFRRRDRWENLTVKPIVATHQEQRFNPRSRSAKLRIARKVGKQTFENQAKAY